MKTADWLGRILCCVLYVALYKVHDWLFGAPENDLLGVAIYACASAIFNIISLVIAAFTVKGKASSDLQYLALCAAVVNFLSFIAYLAKSSPMVHYLNLTIMVISYVQLTRLIWPDRHDPIDLRNRHRRGTVFYIADLSGKIIHAGKEEK